MDEDTEGAIRSSTKLQPVLFSSCFFAIAKYTVPILGLPIVHNMTRTSLFQMTPSSGFQTDYEALPMHETPTRRVDADLLIPGRGEPIKNGTLVYKESKIVYAGEQFGMPREYAHIERTRVPVLMPGLW